MNKVRGYRRLKLEVEVFNTGYRLASVIRVKHQKLWYDVTVKQEYTKNQTDFMEDFEDLCIYHKLHWKPSVFKVLGYDQGDKPSQDQTERYCALLEDKKRVERVKKLDITIKPPKTTMI